MKPMAKLNVLTGYALAFGLFLGLAIIKFGNPVILDQNIPPPASFNEIITEFWPSHWAVWIWLPFAFFGAWLCRQYPVRRPGKYWLWLPPLIWLGWQGLAATTSVDGALTASTLPQFAGCVGCYFLGLLVLGRPVLMRWLLAGVLAGFTVCLIRAVDQRVFEFPQTYQALVEGEKSGWTNMAPETFLTLKQENFIVTTNGSDQANPLILEKLAKRRVNGTLVYPNALAGIILLILPAALTISVTNTKNLRFLIRLAVIAMTIGLGVVAFIFTGSKLGWLLALGLGGLMLFRLDWSSRLKWLALGVVLVVGLGAFAVVFHKYFANGATSVGARLDYWRAAAQTTASHPFLGTGPGTFQRPYARLLLPDAEMARLTHNDYLEQFSDSGVVGGLAYFAWISMALTNGGRRIWRHGDHLQVALFAGLLAWFIQGFGEFSLYIPALAWTAFTLMGCLTAISENEFDKKPAFD